MYSDDEAINNQLDTKGGYTSLKLNGRCNGNNGFKRASANPDQRYASSSEGQETETSSFPLLTAEERITLSSSNSRLESTINQTSLDEQALSSNPTTDSSIVAPLFSSAPQPSDDMTIIRTELKDEFGKRSTVYT